MLYVKVNSFIDPPVPDVLEILPTQSKVRSGAVLLTARFVATETFPFVLMRISDVDGSPAALPLPNERAVPVPNVLIKQAPEGTAPVQGNCVDVRQLGSYIPYIGKISFANVPYGYTGVYQATEALLQQINYQARSGKETVRAFDIQLTDRYGNIINTPNNCFIDMHFAFYYEP